MTVSTTTSRVEYAGNGSTTAFSVPFYFLANGDLKVYKAGVLQTLTTHYTVSGAGNPAGGTVTFLSAPTTGQAVVVFRDPALTQNTDYVPNDPFPAESHERALDRLTMIAQRNRDLVGRAFVLSDGDTSGASTTLPSPEANKVIAWNSAGTALQNRDATDFATALTYADRRVETFTGNGSTVDFVLAETPAVIANTDIDIEGVSQVPGVDYQLLADGVTIRFDAAPPNGQTICVKYGQAVAQSRDDAATVYYAPAGTGAVSQSVQAKLRETVSVKGFGAVGDGVTDDTAAIQAAAAALGNNAELNFPPGDYLVSRPASGILLQLNNLENIKITGHGARVTTNHDLTTGEFVIINMIACNRVIIDGLDIDYDVTAVPQVANPSGVGNKAVLIQSVFRNSDGACSADVTIQNCTFKLFNTSSSATWPTNSFAGGTAPLPEGDDPYYKLIGIFFYGKNQTASPSAGTIIRHKHIRVLNCRFRSMTARTFWPWACEDVQFCGNILENVGARRPQVRCIVHPRGMRISNNTFYGNNAYSLENTIVLLRQVDSQDEAEVAEVSGNTFFFCRGAGITVGGMRNVSITGNVFQPNPYYTDGFTPTSNERGYAGILLGPTNATTDEIKNISIVGNTFNGKQYGVFVNSSISVNGWQSDITVSGNTILNVPTFFQDAGAISVSSDTVKARNVVISNNTIRNETGSKANGFGIRLASVLNGHVSGNVIENTSAAIYQKSEAGNLTIANNSFVFNGFGIYSTSVVWPKDILILTGVTGSFNVSDTVTGGSSGITGTVSTVTTTATYGTSIVITGASGVFTQGETVTSSSGGSGTLTYYYTPREYVVANNTFIENGVGVRNYSDSPIINNVFIKNTTVAISTAYGGYLDNKVNP